MQRSETTWAHPGNAHGPRFPVTQVSWYDAVEFCNWLCRREKLPPAYINEGQRKWRFVAGLGYRLPTEAEWEFACRAGTESPYYWGDDPAGFSDYEWLEPTSAERPYPVGSKLANPFGLFDMLGNVREWTADWCDDEYYAHSAPDDPPGAGSGTQRAQRGGAYLSIPRVARSAHRTPNLPERRLAIVGFRIAQSIDLIAP